MSTGLDISHSCFPILARQLHHLSLSSAWADSAESAQPSHRLPLLLPFTSLGQLGCPAQITCRPKPSPSPFPTSHPARPSQQPAPSPFPAGPRAQQQPTFPLLPPSLLHVDPSCHHRLLQEDDGKNTAGCHRSLGHATTDLLPCPLPPPRRLHVHHQNISPQTDLLHCPFLLPRGHTASPPSSRRVRRVVFSTTSSSSPRFPPAAGDISLATALHAPINTPPWPATMVIPELGHLLSFLSSSPLLFLALLLCSTLEPRPTHHLRRASKPTGHQPSSLLCCCRRPWVCPSALLAALPFSSLPLPTTFFPLPLLSTASAATKPRRCPSLFLPPSLSSISVLSSALPLVRIEWG